MNMDKDTAQAFFTAYLIGEFPTLIEAFIQSTADENDLSRGDADNNWQDNIDLMKLQKEMETAWNIDELCILVDKVNKHLSM